MASGDPRSVEIRVASRSQIPAVLLLWRDAADGPSISDDEDGLCGLLDRDDAALLVAVRGGEIVGTVIAGWDGWRCHLYRLAVSSRHRRQGIATSLLEAAEARFRGLGGRRADALVVVENTRAHRTWSANGYEPEHHALRWTKPLA
ncbi:MAG: GNAT family N-acetyltransferase [Acidimicrobiia bacterium]